MELLLSLLFVYFSTTPTTCFGTETDFSALLEFKNAVVDDPLGALRSWNETVHFCDWEGILCSKRYRGRVVSINLRSQGLVGSLPPHLGNLSFLKAFILQNNSFYGEIPEEFGGLRHLEVMEFSNNFFSGEIPRNLAVEYLDLSQNNLSGCIPSFLGNELKLKNLNLSFNRLRGEVPTQGVFQNGSAISLEGNEYLCGGLAFLMLPPCSSTTNFRKKHFSNLLKILISVLGAGAVCLTLSTCIGLFVCRKRTLQEVQSSVPSLPGFFLRVSYADLVKATYGFSKANLLGSGRFGSVYRGILAGKHWLVAVKVLNLEIKGASKSFVSECNAIKEIRHRNLLKILTVCESIDFLGNSFQALIYEFMVNGSLEKWLHNDCVNTRCIRKLSITQKLNIVIDVAAAVEYLHHGTNSIIIHGDLKPSNILLDENMAAHVGDFGLAKVVSNIYPAYDGSSSSVAIKGTFGYIPPEYGMTNSMTIQGDVYSFGIIVLEMFTNIRPTDDVALNDQLSLHHLVSHALQSQEINIVDQIIPHEYRHNTKIMNCVACLLEVGVACSKQSPKDRMSMTDVVSELHKIRNWNGFLG